MNSNDAQLFAVVSIFAGSLVTIFWMVVGWRAMRAHEKIAASLSEDLEQKSQLLRSTLKKDRHKDEKTFRDFLDADPIAKHLDSTEQMRRFVEWKNQQA
jgi:formiminotetrahydrofolate cyclodeaminase